MKKLAPLCLMIALAVSGCGTQGIPGLQAPPPTVAACIPTVLQDAQNLHQLEGGLAAITAAPVTVMPPPVMTQPPPVVVTPTPSGPVVTPAPSNPVITTPSALTPPGGPIVTPSARLPRRHSAKAFDFSGSTFRLNGRGEAVPIGMGAVASQ
jgi:hypothetical protein